MAKGIHLGTTDKTDVMRGRDVFQRLNGKVDPNLLAVLTHQAEIVHTTVKAVAELATMFDQMVDTMQSFGDVAENMKNAAEQLRRGTQAEVDGDEAARDS